MNQRSWIFFTKCRWIIVTANAQIGIAILTQLNWKSKDTAVCRIITLLRPSIQSLAVAHIITSDPPRCQPYWCRPRVVRLSETGHSWWLPHEHGMPYHNSFRTRLLFLFSSENWRLRSVPVVVPWCDLTMNCALSTCPLLNAVSVMSPCTGRYKPFLLILYGGLAQQCDNATIIIFISTTTTTTTSKSTSVLSN